MLRRRTRFRFYIQRDLILISENIAVHKEGKLKHLGALISIWGGHCTFPLLPRVWPFGTTGTGCSSANSAPFLCSGIINPEETTGAGIRPIGLLPLLEFSLLGNVP